jgi:D-glycero-D-manno-heptose 1,7-bisphosphate phosphatase
MNEHKAALFLDRDGVVNKNHGYVFKISEFEFFPEIFEICRIAQSLGMPIVIVTNQSGIGRGFFTETDFRILTDWMISKFLSEQIEIDLVLHSPESPTENLSAPSRRKPSPAMILEAAEKLNLNLSKSVLIGDNESDMLAAERAGMKYRILINQRASNSVASNVVKDHSECLIEFNNVVSKCMELQ